MKAVSYTHLETSGLRPGEIVEASGAPVSVTLAPGILDNIFDGIERPLERIADKGGAFITRGVSVDSLDREKKWKTHLTVKKGDVVPVSYTHLYLRTPGLSITFLTVPVAVAAMILGPKGGAICGATFGITSLMQCFGTSAFRCV